MCKSNFIISLVLITILLSITLISAEPIDWDGYTSIYVVLDVLDDGNYYWLATLGGLVHYNKTTGDRLVYTTANSGLTSNFITSLAKDESGNLWIGTDLYVGDFDFAPDYYGGLHLFDTTGNWTVYQSSNSPLPSNIIMDLDIDSAGNIWVATYFSGLARLTPQGEWTVFNPQNSALNSYNITAIHITDNDEIWVTLDEYYTYDNDNNLITVGGGTASYNNGVWTDYFAEIPMDYDSVRFWDVTEDAAGNIWFAGGYDGYYCYDGVEFIRYEYPFIEEIESTNNNLQHLAQSRQGAIPRDKYLDMLITNSFEETDHLRNVNPEDTRSGSVSSVTIDNNGYLWLGTSHGAGVYNGVDWYLYNQYNSPIAEYNINNIYADSCGRILIASTFYGLFLYEDGIIEQLDISNPESGLASMHIWDVAANHPTSVWIAEGFHILNNGTGGLTEYDNPFWANYSYNEIDTWTVNDILVNDGVVYLATGNIYDQGGVLSYDGSGWTYINQFNSNLQHPYADGVAVDSQGNIWMSRFDMISGGVAYYDGSSWNHYNNNNSGLLSNEVITIAVDPIRDELWAGTKLGLFKFNGESWQHFHPGNTPAFQTGEIWNLYFDDNNTLWIGNLFGLVSFDGQNWVNHNNNLPILNDGYCSPVVSTTMDEYGRIWHGTLGGIVLFDGDNVEFFNRSNSPLPSDWTMYISSNLNGRMWVGTPATGLYTFTYSEGSTSIDNSMVNEYGVLSLQNYPNPFNPSTTISFSINETDRVALDIYNVKGQKVNTLINNQIMETGAHNVIWNGRDDTGRAVGSGVYFYKLSYRGQELTRRMMLIK